jgi:excisionase family DNA binding protein
MIDRAQYLRAGDIARLLPISERTVRRWMADGTLPSTKIGGARLVARADLTRVLRIFSCELGELTGNGQVKTD